MLKYIDNFLLIFFSQENWYFGLGHAPFLSHCPAHTHRDCLTTRDPFYVEDISQFDAVLMNSETLRCPGLSQSYLNKGRSESQR